MKQALNDSILFVVLVVIIVALVITLGIISHGNILATENQ